MIFIITDKVFRAGYTGEYEIYCVVEGEVWPDELLKEYRSRVEIEIRRREKFEQSFPENRPIRPDKPWWKSFDSYMQSSSYLKYQDNSQKFYEKFAQYSASYIPDDVIPEIPEFLQQNGYKLIDYQII